MAYRYAALDWNKDIGNFIEKAQQNLTFDLSYDWLAATEKYMLGEHEFVVWHSLFDSDDEICACLPLIHARQSRVSHQTIRSLWSYYAALTDIYSIDDDKENNFSQKLLSEIVKQHRWSKMELAPIANGHSLIKASESLKLRSKTFWRFNNWFNYPPHNFEEYVATLPSRLTNTIKRKTRKLTKQHKWKIEIYSHETDLSIPFEHFKQIYNVSWKHQEFSYDFILEVCVNAAQKNKLRLALMYVDERPVAAQIWFVHATKASIFKLAYDPEFQNFSVGSILSYALFEHVIEQDKVTEIDYGMGDEPYKSEWMTDKRPRVGLVIFNLKTLKGFLGWLRHCVAPSLLGK